MLLCTLTHFLINVTWFALLCQQKFDDRLRFRPGELFELLSFWIALKQIFLWEWHDFHYKLILENAMFTFMGKKFSRKKFILLFSKKFPSFVEWPLYYNFNTKILSRSNFLERTFQEGVCVYKHLEANKRDILVTVHIHFSGWNYVV